MMAELPFSIASKWKLAL